MHCWIIYHWAETILFKWSSSDCTGFSRRAGDRRFSPCTKVYHAGYKFWIHFIFGTTLNVSTKETKRFLLSAYKVLCKCRICSYKCCRFSKFPGGACSRTLLDDPPLTSILSPPTMPHLGEPWLYKVILSHLYIYWTQFKSSTCYCENEIYYSENRTENTE